MSDPTAVTQMKESIVMSETALQAISYTTKELAALVDLPHVDIKKVLTWVDRGYLLASIEEASGHGSKRRWSSMDLQKARYIAELEPILRVNALRGHTLHGLRRLYFTLLNLGLIEGPKV
tara:strand:- start:2128 stop:2487 length:360 start_codon:yes stop_codon:yes gene_type:complete